MTNPNVPPMLLTGLATARTVLLARVGTVAALSGRVVWKHTPGDRPIAHPSAILFPQDGGGRAIPAFGADRVGWDGLITLKILASSSAVAESLLTESVHACVGTFTEGRASVLIELDRPLDLPRLPSEVVHQAGVVLRLRIHTT